MSRSDDGKPRSSLRDGWLAAFVLAIPLAWVGTQSMDDEPLYAINASSRPLHAAVAQTNKPISIGGQALMRWHDAGDVRDLLFAKGIAPGTGYGSPLLSRVHNGKAKNASPLSLDNFGAQDYQLAVTDAR